MGQKTIKTPENSSNRGDLASIKRIGEVARQRVDEIAKIYGLRGALVGYRKTLAL